MLSHGWKWIAFPAATVALLIGLSLIAHQQRESLLVALSCMLGIAPIVLFHLYQRDARDAVGLSRRCAKAKNDTGSSWGPLSEWSGGLPGWTDRLLQPGGRQTVRCTLAERNYGQTGARFRRQRIAAGDGETAAACHRARRQAIGRGYVPAARREQSRSGSNGYPAAASWRASRATAVAGRDRAPAH